MAGVTDRVFREIVYELAPGLAYTEMISAMALLYANPRTFKMIDFEPHRPLAVQLFGSKPEVMAEAAKVVEARCAPTFIDINMGCPTPKIVSNGDGAALMKRPQLAAEIVEAVASSVQVPVTVKIRAGWDESSINAPEFAKLMVKAGAQAVAVHGRTRSQFYTGTADWEIVRAVAEAVDVPVIGNGDIMDVETAAERLATSGCAGIMIGRGALGNPWLISRARKLIAEGEAPQPPSAQERLEMAINHLQRAVAYEGEEIAVPAMRKHIAWYLKGLRGASEVKTYIQTLKSADEVVAALKEYQAKLAN
ncbi:MAG: tRNA dihydrouridine synthase DusB [Firmicutes bacterium]|nr:tRNA dihydrouridine synthase DusB [Bacillota bacterium]